MCSVLCVNNAFISVLPTRSDQTFWAQSDDDVPLEPCPHICEPRQSFQWTVSVNDGFTLPDWMSLEECVFSLLYLACSNRLLSACP